MKHFFIVMLVSLLLGCSTTQYDSSALITNIDKLNLGSETLMIDSQNIVLASQANERLFKLHHNEAEINEIFNNIATRFGFQLTDEAHAAYRLNVLSVKPDGGACLEGLSSFNKNMTFTFSVITLGVLPATNGYCIEVTAALLYRPEVYGELSEDMTSLASFTSNQGRINVVAGANEVDNYQRTVTMDDEARAIETSVASLFEDMIEQGAFE